MEKLYIKPKGASSRMSSFENRTAGKGIAGKENNGAKGHAFDKVMPGECVTLLDFQGAGIIHRIWCTMSYGHLSNPYFMRSVVLRCYWDGCSKPAVEAPFGDFIGVGNHMLKYENELFCSPEGRSINIYIPMPFKKSALITLTNESGHFLPHLFYDIELTALNEPEEENLYFHCYWHRENPTVCERDFEILPYIEGKGRFLGTSMVVNANKNHGGWWGEGQFKAYIDGDKEHPTLCGTGSEDYIGTGWGQGIFINRYNGSTFADGELKRWTFYRYHIKDPVYFDYDIRVTMQQLGGDMGGNVRKMYNEGHKIVPVSVDRQPEPFVHLYKNGEFDKDSDVYDPKWINFFREDDVAAAVYFYLDKPENELKPIQPQNERVEGLENNLNAPPSAQQVEM